MYAFISNECRRVLISQQQLDFFMSIYSYPKFKKCNTMEEVNSFFAANDRKIFETKVKHYGKNKVGYITIEYFIDGYNIYYNVQTQHFGYIKLRNIPDNVKIDSQYDLMKIKILNVILNDKLIAHHCIAIQQILRLFGDYINIEIVIPSVSIFIALTRYTGKNFIIRNTQGLINCRMAETYYTVR